MDEIIALAERLGKLIAAHPRTKALEQAAAAIRDNGEAQELLQAHQKQVAHIQQLEAEIKPVEVADKQKLGQLEAKIASNELIKSLMKVRADYAELMQKVNAAIESPRAVRQGDTTSGG